MIVGTKMVTIFDFEGVHRRSKKVKTKMRIGSKYRDQKCIFALNI